MLVYDYFHCSSKHQHEKEIISINPRMAQFLCQNLVVLFAKHHNIELMLGVAQQISTVNERSIATYDKVCKQIRRLFHTA